MKDLTAALLSIFAAIIGLAILSVIISRQSQAPQVIQAGADALSKVIRAAVNPVASASTNGNLGANAFSMPQIEEYLYNTPGGQNLARDVYSTIAGIGGYK